MVNESVEGKEAWNESVREVWDQGLRSTYIGDIMERIVWIVFFLYIFYVRSSVPVYSTDQSYVQYSMFFLYFSLKKKKEDSWGVTVRTLVSNMKCLIIRPLAI